MEARGVFTNHSLQAHKCKHVKSNQTPCKLGHPLPLFQNNMECQSCSITLNTFVTNGTVKICIKISKLEQVRPMKAA